MQLDLVSDFVCPWCFIGLARLDRAIELVHREKPDFQCAVRWRPFFLNPDTPPEGEPYLPFLIRKFGGRERVEALFDHVRQAGAADGIDYAFEKITLRANTLQAHRLVAWVQARGDDARPLVNQIFAAQFQEGRYIGDKNLLANLAEAAGQDRQAAAAFLAGKELNTETLAEERHYRQRGVNVVPTFIVADQLAIPGAEDPAILARALLEHAA